MGMFDGRFKSRGHHDFRMDAGSITGVHRPLEIRKFDANYVIYRHLENQLLYGLHLKNAAEYNFFLDFVQKTMTEEDYQAFEEGTLSNDKVEEYRHKYLEEYQESFEKYLEEFNATHTLVTESRQTKWQVGGSCFTDKHLDFKSVADIQEVSWGVLFSVCAFIPVFLIAYFLLGSILGGLALLVFSGIILTGYSSLLVRHLNYRGWSKEKGLVLPIASGIICLGILGVRMYDNLNQETVSLDNLIGSFLSLIILENVFLMIYLLILACIRDNHSKE